MGETMNCRCIENYDKLALLVGRDAPDELPETLRRSVASCPKCRDHYRGLCDAIGVIDRVHEEPVSELKTSLWNSLSQRLPEKQISRNRYQEWKQQFFPIFSLTAACLALAIVFLDGRFQDNQQRVYQTTSAKGFSGHVLPLLPALDESQNSQLQVPSAWPNRQAPYFNESSQSDSQEDYDEFLEIIQRIRANQIRN
ncbi:MAG: hypothetical protein CMN21_19550 [Rubinisphaera sp.]|nr:hypothetical protein [Rubinisphaera sp.]